MIHLYLNNAHETEEAEFLTLSNMSLVNRRVKSVNSGRTHRKRFVSSRQTAASEIGQQQGILRSSGNKDHENKTIAKNFKALSKRIQFDQLYQNDSVDISDVDSKAEKAMNDSVSKIKVPTKIESPVHHHEPNLSEIELAITSGKDEDSRTQSCLPDSPKFGTSVQTVVIRPRAKTPRPKNKKKKMISHKSLSSFSRKRYKHIPSFKHFYNPKLKFYMPVNNLWSHVIRVNREVAKKTRKLSNKIIKKYTKKESKILAKINAYKMNEVAKPFNDF